MYPATVTRLFPRLPLPPIAAILLAIFAAGSRADVVAQAGDSSPQPQMSLLQAAVLGVVEGVTEYLPVSSTGHLILAQKAMGLGDGDGAAKQAADAYAICIQAGAIVAVLGLYARRVKQMTLGLAGRDVAGRRIFINIVAAFLPAAVIGLLFDDMIEQHLFGLTPVVIAWFVGGVAILLVAWHRRGTPPREGHNLAGLTTRAAIIIGFAQCIAMWPGTSRSLVTIVGGVLVGLSLPAAVEFSFLLGVVTLGAATCYKALQHGDVMLDLYGPASLVTGFIAATLSAVLAVKWMVAYLNTHGLAIFGYYRVAIALIVAALMLLKVL